MDRSYAISRIKAIVASFVGVEDDDVEEGMCLSEFHLNDMDVIFLLEKIEEEFETEMDSDEFSAESTVADILGSVLGK